MEGSASRSIVCELKFGMALQAYSYTLDRPWLLPSAILLPAGFLIYGWSAQHQVHWIVPCIGLFLLGAGNIGFMQPTQVYAIETFQMYAASALAAM